MAKRNNPKPYKIVLDENIVLAEAFFGKIAGLPVELVKKAGRNITQKDLVDADALLVRSVTQVNQALLQNTTVKFVGTATIGTDHIDKAYLKKHHITFADAAGCSADTVAQYVLTAMYALRKPFFEASRADVTLGIVGFGNIGKALATHAHQIGWQILVYDPFVTVSDQINGSNHIKQVTLKELLSTANVVSLHVPLTTNTQSDYPTYHLINAETLAQLKNDALLVNTARGKVVNEKDLLENIANTKRDVVLDVFEHEPMLSSELASNVKILTPHIAGYSLEGKARGTQYIYNAFCKHVEQKAQVTFETFMPKEPAMVKAPLFANAGLLTQGDVYTLIPCITNIYDIYNDDAMLRSVIAEHAETDTDNMKVHFDGLRKNYKLRREWVAYGL